MAIHEYPLGSIDGQAIPNEVANPSSANRILVTAVAMGTPLAITPAEGAICQVKANKPMLLSAGSAAVAPADVAYGASLDDAMWLEAHKMYTVWIKGANISAITVEGSAELLINVIHGWDVLASQGQLDNG